METILYAEDEGIELSSSAINVGVQLYVQDMTNDRIAFEIDTEDYSSASTSTIINLYEDEKTKHFRSLLDVGDKISLFKRDDDMPDDELVHIYFSGNGVVSIYGNEHVGIKKRKSNSDDTLLLFIPSYIASSLDYIKDTEATELEEIEHTLHHAINTSEKLHALIHANVSHSLRDTINSEILLLDGHITSLRAKKKSLSKRPNFEAAKRKYLIEGLEAFMKKNGFMDELNKIKSEALRKATENIGTTKSDTYKQCRDKLTAHPLNHRFEDFFKTGRPTPLPLFKCKQCGNRPALENSKNPNTRKKRYTITCSQCDNKPKEYIHGNASHAIYHWTKECAAFKATPSDVKPLHYNERQDGEFPQYVEFLTDYIKTYKAFLQSYQEVHDHDAANFVSAGMGKLRHLSDGILIGKFIQKKNNAERQ